MSFKKFLCKDNAKDPLLSELYSTYDATPFLPPSEGIKPLDLIGHRGQKTKNFGPFAEMLVKSGTPFELTPEMATRANVELKKTMSFNVDLGFKLLDQVFNGFKLKIDPLQAGLNNVKELSLSFQNVQRKHIPHTLLGSALTGRKLDLSHVSMGAFKRAEKPLGMYVIASVLQCNTFSIHLNRAANQNLSIADSEIGKLTDVGFKVKNDQKEDLVISHGGSEYLTFAFSCYKLNFDPQGVMSLEEEVAWEKGVTKESSEPTIGSESIEISFMSPTLPAILTWDDEV